MRCSRKRGTCHEAFTREEELDAQVAEALRMAAITPSFAAELHAILDAAAELQTSRVASERSTLEAEIAICDQRQRRLLEMSVDGAISIEEFREAKNKLMLERHQKAEKLSQLASGVTERFGKLRWLTNASLEATCVIERGEPAEMIKFFKSVGLEWTLLDRRLQWVPREPWQLIVGQDLVQMGPGGVKSDLACVGAQDREERIKRRGGDSNPRYRL